MARLDRREAALWLAAIGLGGAGAACSPAGMARAAPARRARTDLYLCEGCEATREREAQSLVSTAVLAGPDEPGERLRVNGRVLAADGATPVSGVVIYAHHTNAEGLYANGSSETEWSRRHGRLRGWMRSDDEGRYGFQTIKPAPYPNMTMPAHVHLFILESGRPAYYIDDVVFDGEFKVDAAYHAGQELRGGSGIVRTRRSADGAWRATRDIVLEPHPA